eukprot:CAMPEP_0114226788 /NCGR_PEP_ID=MMETSP0058-20121206/1427_1 /TAXON_ID=36894 /ORGANISM="Pyramimonas parkeae, CCMP726" /LENGTH=391 /DNA_ID=CAMNT_0001337553 /DNA_START=227 /DNA_END=1399 /DNA_ORIENTATION=+
MEAAPTLNTCTKLFTTATHKHNHTPRNRKPKNLVIGDDESRPDSSSIDWANLKKELQAEAKRLGLGPTLVTSAEPSSRVEVYERWLEQGFHGKMESMARADRLARRRDLSAILPGVRSVIVSTLFYLPGKDWQPPISQEPLGSVSSYAWGEDYHVTLGRKLRNLAEWLHARCGGRGMWYVDTGAVQERDLGERCGMGFIGKNSMLINKQLGSGFFIGELLTTLPLPADLPPVRGRGGCGTCTKCRLACPTSAIVEDYVVDARRCISYLTIELKESIPEDLRPLMGNKVYGCDICQEVCPWNKFSWEGGGSPLFGSPPAEVTSPKLLELLQLDEDGFQERFATSPIRRIGRARMARNAAVALGNSAQASVIPVLRSFANNEKNLMVKEHIEW